MSLREWVIFYREFRAAFDAMLWKRVEEMREALEYMANGPDIPPDHWGEERDDV